MRSPWKYYNESQICVPCYMQVKGLIMICRCCKDLKSYSSDQSCLRGPSSYPCGYSIANLRNKGLLHVDDTGQLCASKWAPYKNSRSRTYAKGCKVTQLLCMRACTGWCHCIQIEVYSLLLPIFAYWSLLSDPKLICPPIIVISSCILHKYGNWIGRSGRGCAHFDRQCINTRSSAVGSYLLSSQTAIMDATSIADNTTVVAGPSSNVNPKDLSHHQYDFLKPEKTPSSSTQGPDKKTTNDFGKAADLTMANRQFFVTIGHDGLIGALQKLDRELQNVSNSRTPLHND